MALQPIPPRIYEAEEARRKLDHCRAMGRWGWSLIIGCMGSTVRLIRNVYEARGIPSRLTKPRASRATLAEPSRMQNKMVRFELTYHTIR